MLEHYLKTTGKGDGCDRRIDAGLKLKCCGSESHIAVVSQMPRRRQGD